MTDTTNDIDALLREINPNAGKRPEWDNWNAYLTADQCRRMHAALTALVAERDALKQENDALRSRQKVHQDEVLNRVFEMDALKKRIAELESHPPADRDRELRERLIESALQGAGCATISHQPAAELLGRQAVWVVDGALAAMRKGDGDGK